MPLSTEDLHGDGRFCNGDIDIISPNRFLGNTIESTLDERIHTDLFNSGNHAGSLNTQRNLTSILFGLALSTDGCMSGIRQPSPFFRSRLGHPQIHGIASSPRCDSHLDQTIYNKMTGDTKNLGHMLNRFSGLIDLAEIVEINILSYHGYVYDCQTLSTLYIGNGLISSNCRCPELYKADLPDASGPKGDFALNVSMVESASAAEVISIREREILQASPYSYHFHPAPIGNVAGTIVDCGRPGRIAVTVLDGGKT
jgi:hypothetical protein